MAHRKGIGGGMEKVAGEMDDCRGDQPSHPRGSQQEKRESRRQQGIVATKGGRGVESVLSILASKREKLTSRTSGDKGEGRSTVTRDWGNSPKSYRHFWAF